METKAIFEKVAVAVITAIVFGIGAFFMGVFEKGTSAISEEQILVVLNKTLVTDSGKTYKARLAEINGELVETKTRVELLKEEVKDLEDLLRDLTAP
jgi:hypothetical protein